MSKRKSPKQPGMGNTAYAVAMAGKRSSSAAGTHADKRDRRNRTRSAQRARAIREAW